MNILTRRAFTATASGAMLAGATKHVSLAKSNKEPSRNRKKIKIGQLGIAHPHAAGKMAALRKLHQDFDVVGIYAGSKKLMEDKKDLPAYKGLKWMSAEEMLNIPGLQAVAIEGELSDLIIPAIKCAKAGLHIHLDKPPGSSLNKLKILMNLAEKKNLIVQMGYMYRYNAAFQFCLNAMKKGWIGEVFRVHGVMSKALQFKRRAQIADIYGGTMMDLGGHLIDILIAVCGRPDKVTSFQRQTFKDKDDLFDNELAVFEYPNCIGTIESAMVEVGGNRRRQFVICGEKGSLEIKPLEPPQLCMTLSEDCDDYKAGHHVIDLPEMSGRYDDQLEDFARMVRGEKSAEYTYEHDLIAHEALLRACNRSLND